MFVPLLCFGHEATFYPGNRQGCSFKKSGEWVKLTDRLLKFQPGMSLKTDAQGWGTLEYSFGTLTIRPNTLVQALPQGIYLATGGFRGHIMITPKGFAFKMPSATLGIRGTIFDMESNGYVSVLAGKVELSFPDQSVLMLAQGETSGSSSANESHGNNHDMVLLDSALKAEHDKNWELSTKLFLEAFSRMSSADKPALKRKCLEGALFGIAQGDLSNDHEYVTTAVQALSQFPEAFFSALEKTLRLDMTKPANMLLNMAKTLNLPAGEDIRESIAEILISLSDNEKPAPDTLKEAQKKLNRITSKLGKEPLKDFWASSLAYSKILVNPESVKPEDIERVLSTKELESLAPEAFKKRIDAVMKLPAHILEARSLFLLFKACIADGDFQKALDIFDVIGERYPDTPWCKRAHAILKSKQKKSILNENHDSSKSNESAPEINMNHDIPGCIDQSY